MLYARVIELAVLVVVATLLVVTVLSDLGLLPEYWAAVGSYSMVPTLEIGDLVLLTPVKTSSILLGKVIVYRGPGGEEIIHRVIKILNGGVRTKGDANPLPDPFIVPLSSIRGVVTAVIPYVGFPSVVLKNLLQGGASVIFLLLAVSYVIVLLTLRVCIR